MSIKKKDQIPRCDCYPHPILENESDFSVVERHEDYDRWPDYFLKCNICGLVGKNAISHNYYLSRNFPVAPEGWDSGVHPDFKELYDAWVDANKVKVIEMTNKVLEKLYVELELLTGVPSGHRIQGGWEILPSGLILPKNPT